MKKFVLIAVGLMLCLGLLTGCDMLSTGGPLGPSGPGEQTVEKTPLEQVEEKYARLADAARIEEQIGIVQGKLVQYESEKAYEKRGSGYRITGTEKRLNLLDSGKEGAYTETSVDTSVKAGDFRVRLDLDELYFSTAPVFTDGTMEVMVDKNNVETVFAVRDLPAPVIGLTLRIHTDETHVTDMEIEYASKSSSVKIQLKFTY